MDSTIYLLLGGAVMFVVRAALVAITLDRELRAASDRCRRRGVIGAVRSAADVRQEYASVGRAIDRYGLLILDLRKWTHRQFFPHGSAR